MKLNATVEVFFNKESANLLFWWSGAAAFIVAALSGASAGFKYWREQSGREWDRAHQAYEKFLDIAVENPEFIPGYWSDPANEPKDRNKFRWFMARFLWAAEQALVRVPWRRRKQWKRVIKVMLREHADFIASPETRDEVDCYYGPLKKLIDEVVAETGAANPLPSPP